MSDADDGDDPNLVIDGIQDSMVIHADSIDRFGSG
jgi:hypothetical protein